MKNPEYNNAEMAALDALEKDKYPNKKHKFKYSEDKILSEITNYITKTYKQHYTTKSGAQIQDVLTDLDIGRDFCHGNAIKYLIRYGKKKGFNRDDLLKAVHYTILLMHYDNKK